MLDDVDKGEIQICTVSKSFDIHIVKRTVTYHTDLNFLGTVNAKIFTHINALCNINIHVYSYI